MRSTVTGYLLGDPNLTEAQLRARGLAAAIKEIGWGHYPDVICAAAGRHA